MPKITKQLPPSSSTQANGSGNTGSAWELSSHVKLLLYGKSGTGKTTLWSTFPSPILALICSGGNQPGELKSIDTPENRKRIDARVVNTTDDFTRALDAVSKFQTVVLDHASSFQDIVLAQILGVTELPTQKSWGLAQQKQWGQCTAMCKDLFRALLNKDCNVVIVAQEREFKSDDEATSEVIQPFVGAAVTPQVSAWLNYACDYIVQAFLRPKTVTEKISVAGQEIATTKRGKGVEYCLRTEPHDIFQIKFRKPGRKTLPDVIVNPTYQKIMGIIKE